jgi:hypothetical protein
VELSPTRDAGTKRLLGQYFTVGNPFAHPAFASWWGDAHRGSPVLEPFAGADNIPALLGAAGYQASYMSFDIDPQARSVEQRDTLADFPAGYDLAVTNPPFLARHFARRKGLSVDHLPWGPYNNLWKVAVDRSLLHCGHVAAIVPESLLTSGLFRARLVAVISLTSRMFADSEAPTCLALWGPTSRADFEVWRSDERLGMFSELSAAAPEPTPSAARITFNALHGQVGLRAIDLPRGATIAFCPEAQIPSAKVQVGRQLTRSHITGLAPRAVPDVLEAANAALLEYRSATADVLLAAFKGMRQDGAFRRRMDWGTARNLLSVAVDEVEGVAG